MSKNSSAKYYQDDKERLQKKACERHQNLSKEEKEIKQQYGFERYKNLSLKISLKNKRWSSIEKKYKKNIKKEMTKNTLL